MTNTKFRRRALVSSLAMLLVALVALGSATFAWFTDNPVAKAEGITGKGQTSTGLEIYTDTDPSPTDKHDADFMASAALASNAGNLILVPAWLKDSSGASFLSTKAEYSNDQQADAAETWSSVNVINAGAYDPEDATNTKITLGEGVYKESAYLTPTGVGDTATNIYLTGLTIEAPNASASIKNAVCVAVYVGTDLKGIWKYGTDQIKTYTTTPAVNGTVGSEAQTTTAVKANGTGLATSLGTGTSNSPLAVTFYVYLDGTDELVTTDGAKADTLISKLTANFSTNPPT